MTHPRPFDDIDLHLLQALQAQGRLKRNELAHQTGLSIPAISERLKKLEEQGVISAYRAILDYRKLGFDVTAFVAVTVDSSKHFRTFLERVAAAAEIVECHAITGEGTHLLKVRAQTTAALEKALARMQSWPGVTNTQTRVVLSSPKETTCIPINNNKTPKGG